MIESYLTDTVTWAKSNGRDQWGTAIAPTEVLTAARVDWKTRLVRNTIGEQVVAAGSVLVREAPGHEDTFEINGVRHAILAVAEKKDFGIQFYEAYIA